MNSSLFTPDYSHLTGLIQQLNDDELNELLNSDEKLKAIVSDLKQVHDIEAEREMLLASIKSISEYNLSKEPILKEHREQVEETRKIAFDLKDSLLEKKKKIESGQQATSKETLLALLQAATLEKEEEAEATVEMFLQDELPVDDFLPKYLELRKLAHLRRIKAEKMTSILQENGSRVTTPPFRPQRLRKPPPPPGTTSTGLPYPSSYSNVTIQSNVIMPARQAPQPPVSNKVPYAPCPPGGYFPYPRPAAAPFSYTNPQPPFPQYQPARFGHFK